MVLSVGFHGRVPWSLWRCLRAVFLAVLAGCLVQSPASATGVQVTPISFDFTAWDQAQALWLTNTGQQPVNVQIRIFAWSQADGDDQLTPTRDLVPSSAILTLTPGQRQLVRLMRLNRDAPVREGLSDWSVEVGNVRRDYGWKSFSYRSDPMASATGRYGLTDHLTLEGHAEATKGLVMAGAGGASSPPDKVQAIASMIT